MYLGTNYDPIKPLAGGDQYVGIILGIIGCLKKSLNNMTINFNDVL